MATRLLTKPQFLASFSEPMRRLDGGDDALCDIWPYLAEVEIAPFGLRNIQNVEDVYIDGLERVHHVVLSTDNANVKVILVIGLAEHAVLGHHFLDLDREFGRV